MQTLKVVNGRIWYSGEFQEGEILIEGGIIKKISKHINQQAPQFDAKGCVIFPGLIDVHTHLRDWGQSYKEDVRSGTRAAVAGGFTTLLEMPNTSPPINTPDRLMERKRTIEKRIYCDVGIYAVPNSPAQIQKLREAGAIALKVYLDRAFDDEYHQPSKLSELISKAAQENVLISFHAEHPNWIKDLQEPFEASAHMKAHPPIAELEAVKLILRISRKVPNCRVHLAHISTKQTLALVGEAKKAGIRISCEVTPHHLLLSNKILSVIGRMGVVEPPLRTALDNRALQKGLARGMIDVLATDHAPHAIHEKASSSPPPGFPGLETTLPLALKLVHEGILHIENLVTSLASNPAKIFNLKDRGSIDVNHVANLTIVDFNATCRIDASRFESKAKYSPFDGWEVRGKTYATIVNGRPVYIDGEGVIGGFEGRYIQTS